MQTKQIREQIVPEIFALKVVLPASGLSQTTRTYTPALPKQSARRDGRNNRIKRRGREKCGRRVYFLPRIPSHADPFARLKTDTYPERKREKDALKILVHG